MPTTCMMVFCRLNIKFCLLSHLVAMETKSNRQFSNTPHSKRVTLSKDQV